MWIGVSVAYYYLTTTTGGSPPLLGMLNFVHASVLEVVALKMVIIFNNHVKSLTTYVHGMSKIMG